MTKLQILLEEVRSEARELRRTPALSVAQAEVLETTIWKIESVIDAEKTDPAL